MSKLKSKFGKGIGKRVMALILSGAMVMSNMTVTAAELTSETAVEASAEETATEEITAETEESAVSESTTDKESSESEEAVEKKTEKESESDDSKSKKDTSEPEKEEEGKDEVAVNAETYTYTFDPGTVTLNTAADGAQQKVGTKNYFTLIMNSSSAISTTNNKTISGFTSTGRYTLGGTMTVNTTDESKNKSVIKFTTYGASTVKIWWGAGGAGREIKIVDASNNEKVSTSESLEKGGTAYSELSIDDKGVYYLGGPSGSNYIYKLEVVDTGEMPATETVAWTDVAAPTIPEGGIKLSNDGKSIEVSFNMVINSNTGADKVTVEMTKEGDSEGTYKQTKTYTTAGTSGKVTFTPEASGNYNFKVTASRNGEDSVKECTSASATAFTLPLAQPVVSANRGNDGKVTVSWAEVPEATSYEVIYYTGNSEPEDIRQSETCTADKGYIKVVQQSEEKLATSAVIDATLTDDVSYTIKVTAIRGEGTNDIDKSTGEKKYINSTNTDYQEEKLVLNQTDLFDKDGNYVGSGLKKGVTYSLGSIADLKVLEDMPYKSGEGNAETIDYNAYEGYAQGTKNPDKTVEWQTNTTQDYAVLEFTANRDGKFYITYDNDGKTYYFYKKVGNTVTKVDTGTSPAKGTYVHDITAGETYQFYLVSSKVKLREVKVTSGTRTHAAWSGVTAPVIGEITSEDGVTTVPYIMDTTSADGADKVTVTVSDAAGTVLETQVSRNPSVSSVQFTKIKETGKYTFKITANRDDEAADKPGADKEYTYVLPLTAPTGIKVSNTEDGVVEASWDAMDEVTGYEVTYYLGETKPETISTDSNDNTNEKGFVKIVAADGKVANKTLLEKMEFGKDYTIEVVALRDTEKSEAGKQKVTPEAPQQVNRKGSVSLFSGLKKDTVYGDANVVKITVLEDMAAHRVSDSDSSASDNKAEIEGTTYNGYVQGTNNASPKGGDVAKSGSVFEFEAVKDSKVSLVLNADKNSGKTYHFVNKTSGEEEKTGTLATGTISFELKAGNTYQYYLDGSNPCVYALKYSYADLANYKSTVVNLENGLTTGTEYGDERIAIFTVLANMSYKGGSSDAATLEGTLYNGCVQGSDNPSPNKGKKATSGSVLVIQAKTDATISLVTNAAKNSGKAYHFLDVTDETRVEEIATGDQVTSGTMSFDVEAGRTYQFYLDGSKVVLYSIMAEAGQKVRNNWTTDVALPVIDQANIKSGVETNTVDGVTTKNGYIEVPFNMVIGDNGADKVTVTMADENGTVVGTQITKVKSNTGGSVKFYSKDGLDYIFTSGKYTFTITASREDEEDKAGAESASFEYTLLLEAPSIRSVASTGNGGVEAKWYAAEEATGYNIYYYVKGNRPETLPQTSESNTAESGVVTNVKSVKASISGLTVDTEYVFEIISLRDGTGKDGQPEESDAATYELKVVNSRQTAWEYATYGASTSTDSKNNGYKDRVDDENGEMKQVTVYSANSKGKIVPLSADGISYYYTELDSVSENFVLKAHLKVDTWQYSNGQEGMGLLVSDRVGKNGDEQDPFWNNSYMAAATKIEYRWNKAAGELTTDSEIAANTSMKLGLGSIVRTGVPKGYTGATAPPSWTDKKGNLTVFRSQTDTFETSMGKEYGSGNFNIIGNYSNSSAPEGTKNTITEWDFTIQRDNTGYKLTCNYSYYDEKQGKTVEVEKTNTYYDEKCFDPNCEEHHGDSSNGTLMQMDEDSIYVGFFTARNATVTFSNIELTVTDAATDAPHEERVRKTIDSSFNVVSATNSNSEDYQLDFYSNAHGNLTITQDDGTVVADNDEIQEDSKLSYNVTLKEGANTFEWSMDPVDDEEIGGKGTNTYLKDYGTKSGTFTVTYNTISGRKYIYVSPKGTSKGNGSEEKPLDIYTAVQYVSAGQTIVLTEGTYKLKKSLTISRGISGTADEPIRMIADDEAKTRPVIDFMGTSKMGMKIAGDYWYFYGFDVTRSGDGTDGIQVAGNHNTLDNIMVYKNGNTGIQISRLQSSDSNETDENGEYIYWPSYNTILNCTSYANADKGYEDADGFAAKLTVGNGNVFDGCIAAYNADDGWDLFAKSETGSIGMVTIKNCIAYANGYRYGVTGENGELLEAGNGNGFKMGGTSISGHHTLINSIAFNNRAKGIDSNSCPDIQVENCISFDNGSYNVALYTSAAENTDFKATGVISFRKNVLTYLKYNSKTDKYEDTAFEDYFKTTGAQVNDTSAFKNETTFYWEGDLESETKGDSRNTKKVKVTDDWFVSLVGPDLQNFELVGRTKDTNKIDLGDFLKLTDKAVEGIGAKDLDKTGEASAVIDLEEEKNNEAANNGLVVTTSAKQTYTGKAIVPTIKVTDGINLLSKKNYTVSYKNNVNAGTATITIKGKGNYKGMDATTTFEIVPKNISASEITLKNTQIAAAYNGKVQTPKVTVLWNKKTLSARNDYKISYEAGTLGENGAVTYDESTPVTPTEKGYYRIKIEGLTNYTGVKYAYFRIVDRDKLISKASGKLAFQGRNTSSFDATGSRITFTQSGAENSTDYTIAVTLGGNSLTLGKDYTLTYLDNVKPGRATVTIVGSGDYAGEKQITFSIKGLKFNRPEFGYTQDIPDENNQKVTVYHKGLQTMEYTGDTVTQENPLYLKIYDSTTKEYKLLRSNVDYSVTYKNNDKAGTAKVIFTGKGMYLGSKATATFKIEPYEINTNNIYVEPEVIDEEAETYTETSGHIRISGLEATYVKGGAKLDDLTLEYVEWNETSHETDIISELTLGKDYTVSYRNNNQVATASYRNAPTVVIRGKGAYKGTLNQTFTINAQKLDYNETISRINYAVTVTAEDVAASNSGSASNWRTKVSVADINGKLMSGGLSDKASDTADYVYDYYYASYDEKGNVVLGDKIPDTTKSLTAGTTVAVKVTPGESGNYVGEQVVTYRIINASQNIAKAKVGSGSKEIVYRGEAITYERLTKDQYPTITVNGATLEYNKDYVVVNGSYKNNTNKGTAKVTIRGIGNYGGTKVISFKIEPKELVKNTTTSTTTTASND
jgi:hypothetical protein